MAGIFENRNKGKEIKKYGKAAGVALLWLAAFFAGGAVRRAERTIVEEQKAGMERETEVEGRTIVEEQEAGMERETEVERRKIVEEQKAGMERKTEVEQGSEGAAGTIVEENQESDTGESTTEAFVLEHAGQDSTEQPGAEEETEKETEKDYIKWVDFDVTKEAMQQAYEYDVATHGTEQELSWIELLAYLGTRYGGDFGRYDRTDMEELVGKLQSGSTLEELTEGMAYYPYYLEAYGTVLEGLVGEYEVEVVSEDEPVADGTDSETGKNGESGQHADESAEIKAVVEKTGKPEEKKAVVEKTGEPEENKGIVWVKKYGLKGFHPIARGFPYSDYDDFGVSRSYGYKRQHLGHDMMGQVGTPIIAVESGYVTALGWNQYGGWRIGISSFDGKRYYYYAHLRQNIPYAAGLEEGSIVQAGDVIGYLGRTGYSATENVNYIDTYHLHFGLQLIFDESQREGYHEIWINPYELIRFLYQNQSEVVRNDATKEWSRVRKTRDPAAS